MAAHNKTNCNYCGSVTVDDERGNCGACGAPRSWSNRVTGLATDYERMERQDMLSILEAKLASNGWTDAELNAYLEMGRMQAEAIR